MPRVLRIINRFNLGGITYNVSYLSRYMPAEYETLLIGGPEEEGEESSLFIPHSLGLKPLIIPEMRRSLNPLNDYRAYKKIRSIIREFKPDIVHTHASKAGTLGRLAAASCKVPVIVHTFHGHVFRGYFGKFKTSVFKSIERFLARKSNAIVAISALQKMELSKIHSICAAEKISVIPLGFDLARFGNDQEVKRKAFRKKYGIKDDELALGIIGRLAPIKNHRLFIDSVVHVITNQKKKIKGIIIGDGETRASLEGYITEKGYSYTGDQANFIFTSWIRQVDEALPGLDLVCLTSVNEGTPVSLIEAQAAGKFIVSTNVGGIQDILHPDCGMLSEEGDAERYMKNLLYAVENIEAVKQRSANGAVEVLHKFSYKRLCSDMDALYRQLLLKK